jgi:DNA-binding Lrp family transcriptional regulator
VDLGYIARFAAILSRKLVGRPTLMVTLVKLKAHGAEELRGFASAVKRYAEVQQVLHLSGEFDFMLQVSLCDPLDYEDFLDQKLCCLPMVGKVHSSLVLKEHKMEPALPLFG